MTTTIKELYTAIKGRLKTIEGLNAYDHIPGVNEWPGALVHPPNVEAEGAGDGWQILRFNVMVIVSGAIDEHQLKLLDYQANEGPKSIPAAFRQDPSLGFPDVSARVSASRPMGYEEQAGYQGFGCVFEVVVCLG